MLDLLFVHLDFDRVLLLDFFDLTILVAELRFCFVQLALGDFPECVDFVPLELVVVALLSLPLQVVSQPGDFPRELVDTQHSTAQHGRFSLVGRQSSVQGPGSLGCSPGSVLEPRHKQSNE